MSSFETMWKKSVKDMVQAIKSDNNMRDFFMSFEPNESTGYAWTQNEQYKSYSDILDDKTGRVHSGSSCSPLPRLSTGYSRRRLCTTSHKAGGSRGADLRCRRCGNVARRMSRHRL